MGTYHPKIKRRESEVIHIPSLRKKRGTEVDLFCRFFAETKKGGILRIKNTSP